MQNPGLSPSPSAIATRAAAAPSRVALSVRHDAVAVCIHQDVTGGHSAAELLCTNRAVPVEVARKNWLMTLRSRCLSCNDLGGGASNGHVSPRPIVVSAAVARTSSVGACHQ